MTTFKLHRSLNAALALVLAAAVPACTTEDGRGDVVITKLVPPDLLEGGCILDPNREENAGVIVDLDRLPAGGTFRRGAVVENRLVANRTASGRLNTNDFEAQTARVKISFPDPAFAGGAIERRIPVHGLVQASGSRAVSVEAIPAGVMDTLRGMALPASGVGTIRIATRLEGNLLDGSTIQSSQYEYVLAVCKSCLPPAPTSCPPGQTLTATCTPGTNEGSATCQ